MLDDETLRDGLQSRSGRCPSIDEKLRILHSIFARPKGSPRVLTEADIRKVIDSTDPLHDVRQGRQQDVADRL